MTPLLQNHMAVRMKDCIVVFSSRLGDNFAHEHWIYNLWTETWRKCPINTHGEALPGIQYLCGVTIGPVVYMFGGGYVTSDLWEVSQSTDGPFDWNKLCMQKQKMPSPRCHHTGWLYADKMWIFGGYGKPPVGYLNHHGDFEKRTERLGANNHLIFYDPSEQIWKNMECLGDIPSPRYYTCSAIIRHNVWLYGGASPTSGYKCELYELNLTLKVLVTTTDALRHFETG